MVLVALNSGRDDRAARSKLAEAVREQWRTERESWDKRVAEDDGSVADLWAGMPAIDSKTVARMAPLFKEHLGTALDVSRIRSGGYSSIEEVIEHLVYDDGVPCQGNDRRT